LPYFLVSNHPFLRTNLCPPKRAAGKLVALSGGRLDVPLRT
jgi:hypothetical protein